MQNLICQKKSRSEDRINSKYIYWAAVNTVCINIFIMKQLERETEDNNTFMWVLTSLYKIMSFMQQVVVVALTTRLSSKLVTFAFKLNVRTIAVQSVALDSSAALMVVAHFHSAACKCTMQCNI